MSPEECILYIFSWINIIFQIIWHLELSISPGDENIDEEPKVNPTENTYTRHSSDDILHFTAPVQFFR